MDYIKSIKDSKLSIYDTSRPDLLIPNDELESILEQGLKGLDLSSYAVRTRSKVVKTAICEVLGYEIPKSFTKTTPKFPCQNFDIYTQTSNNLQIWNQDIDFNRRYVIVITDKQQVIKRVKVYTGLEIQMLDRTGTKTIKYQASVDCSTASCYKNDTPNLGILVSNNVDCSKVSPIDPPKNKELFDTKTLYQKLSVMLGESFSYIDSVNERNRSAAVHERICQVLGYPEFHDNGEFPDIPNQLIEFKLQLKQTIDLGLHLPVEKKLITTIDKTTITTNDVRYVVFTADIKNTDQSFTLTHLYVVPGEYFYDVFSPIKGRNSKIQCPLPSDLFK